MRKTTIGLLAAALAVGSMAHADFLELTPHVGYTTVNMAGLNHSNTAIWAWEAQGPESDINSGIVAGLDAMTTKFTHADWLSLGLRGEYLQTNQGQETDYYFADNVFTSNTDQGSLSSLLIGAKVTAPFVGNLSLGLGAWVGYGYATLTQHMTEDMDDGGPNPYSNGVFAGSGLVGELEGSVNYRLGSHLKLSFVGGWRWADFASLQDGNGTPLYDNLELWQFNFKNPVNVDFSGATAQGAVSFLF